MGLFSKKRQPRSEQAMEAATSLGPVVLELDGTRLTLEGGKWRADYYGPVPKTASAMEKELMELRAEKKTMERELEAMKAQAQQIKEAKERWNLLDFKYQLLLDMWTMRVLDNDQDDANEALRSSQASFRKTMPHLN